MPIGVHKPALYGYREYYEVCTYYSDDHGKTWLKGNEVPNPDRVLTQEPGVVELNNGIVAYECWQTVCVHFKRCRPDMDSGYAKQHHISFGPGVNRTNSFHR